MKITLDYSPCDDEYAAVVMISHIVRLSKSLDGETTFIHLSNGEVLHCEDSIRTLDARLNSNET